MVPINLKNHAPIKAAVEGESLVLIIPPQGGDIDIADLPKLVDMRYLVLDITTFSDMHLPIQINFFKIDTEESTISITTSSIPTVRAVIPIDLQWLDNRSIFKARTPGRMKTTVFGTAMAINEIASIKLHIREFHQETRIIVHNIYLSREMPDTTLIDPKPVLDEFGQVSIRDWSGKTKSSDEMVQQLKGVYENAKESKTKGMPYNERFGFSKWGGDACKRLTQGTGYFAVHKEGDIWYLVDPEGYAFFSVGPDCVGTNNASVINGIEKLYNKLPDRKEYADAYSKSQGYYGSAGAEMIDYYRANMIRVFGKDWFDAYCLITEYRLKEMGFNTIANWSDPNVIAKMEMPYVIPLVNFPSTEQIIFRDFPDVFSDEYSKNSTAFAEQLKKYTNDPRLIGYFMRNEPQWGFSNDINLALEMFRYPTLFESQRTLWDFLVDKYGSPVEISKVWGMELKSAECLMKLSIKDLQNNGPHTADLRIFSQKMVERYVEVPAKALRAVDPHHLNLGMRYAMLSSDTMFMGTEHIDIFSINCYRDQPRKSDVDNILERCGKPCIIGEYHHASNDRGCFGNSLCGVTTAEERGVAYQYYTEQTAAMPSLLGCHYFCLGDEPALGRYDGECELLGFIDVCHRLYEEMYEAAIRTHERLYSVKAQKKAPYNTTGVWAPSNCY